jgi:GxxExxY protein
MLGCLLPYRLRVLITDSERRKSVEALSPQPCECTRRWALAYWRAYTGCLQFELRRAGFNSIAQLALPVIYSGVKLDAGYRIDLSVEELVVVEVKSVDAVSPVHHAQIITYLKLSGKSLGLLINFNVVHLKDGIKRFVNGTGWK